MSSMYSGGLLIFTFSATKHVGYFASFSLLYPY
jgi:hypothetical protein